METPVTTRRAVLLCTVLAFAASAEAQLLQSTSKPPTSCTVNCPAGPQGRQGDPGPAGPRGPQGAPGAPVVIPPMPEFDLGVHGFRFLPGEARFVGGRWFLLTYEVNKRAAVMLDLATCVAQIHVGFDAGLGAPLTWEVLSWPANETSLWSHGGATWTWRWNPYRPGLVTANLNALVFNDPRIGPNTPLCRWR